jgi:hypothetical protein
MTRHPSKCWAAFLFPMLALFISGGNCGLEVPICSEITSDDRTNGSACEFDSNCNSDICDNDGPQPSCTCLPAGTGGSGGMGGGGSGGSGGMGTGGSGGSGNECGGDVPCDGEDPHNSCAATCEGVCGSVGNINQHTCFSNEDLEYRCYCTCKTGSCIGR